MSYLQQLELMHVAAFAGVAALAFRNQLHLRAVLLVTILLNIVNHSLSRDGADFNYLFWDVVALGINLYVLALLVLDRTHIGLTEEELRLFQAWGSLTPGEFRRLMRLGTWHVAGAGEILTREGEMPDRLFYVTQGELHILKGGREIVPDAPAFIGEVAFVKERPASATVRLEQDGRYLQWSVPALRRHFTKHAGMRVVVMRLLSADLAMKVARA